MISQLLTYCTELLVLTLARGSLYALIAVGFALVFGAGRVLNLFHGGFFLLGSYLAFFYSGMALPLQDAPRMAMVTLLAAATVGGIGFVYFWAFLRRYVGRQIQLMVVGVVANLVTAQGFSAWYGTQAAYVAPIVPGTIQVGSAQVLRQQILIVCLAIVLFPALGWLLRHTRMGRAIQAVAQDARGARLVGIRPEAVLGTTVALAAMLAGLAGALAAPVLVVSPSLWTFALLKSFTIVILGGIGSLRGTLIASYALGAVEVVGISLVGEAWAELIAVVIAVVALALRPRGVVNEQA
ncbi:MAG TPA: branched-chain amino acid ABC transporter permease [Thermoanaerobaculia bacterium]|nr:branched-chain amino acid ABC transporter permease [Thermoanaerobaculia bacterium]